PPPPPPPAPTPAPTAGERAAALSASRAFRELAELRRENGALARRLAEKAAESDEHAARAGEAGAARDALGEIVAFQKAQLEEGSAQLGRAREELAGCRASEEMLVGRLLTEKASMVAQVVEATDELEALRGELEVTRGLLAKYERGDADAASGRGPADLPSSAGGFLSAATAVPRSLLSISRPHSSDITGLSLSPPSLLTCSADSTCKAFDLSSPGPPRHLCTHSAPTNQPLTCAALSPAGLLAAGGADKCVRLYPPSSPRPSASLQGHNSKVSAVAFRDDGTLLSAAHDRTVKVWAVGGGKGAMKGTMHTGSIPNDIGISVNASSVATAHADGGVRFWDLSKLTKILEMPSVHTGQCTSCEFHPFDGYTVLTTGRDNAIRLLDSRVCQVSLTLVDPKYRCNYNWSNAAFSPDGEYVVSGSGKDVFIWSVRAGKLERVLRGHSDLVEKVVWSAGARQVVSAGKDGSVVVWE
ncbi:hypothetical protein TeGR_g6717, partial [Tetraparma gracilis]